MKKSAFNIISRLSFLFLLLIGATSCQELNIDTQSDYPAKLETDAQESYSVLAAFPQPVVFNISSNTPWKISSDQNWCIPTPALSSASSLIAEITVNIEENNSEEPRTATLQITAEGIKQITSITILQDAKGKLLVQPVEGSLPADGGQSPFTITSNKPWNIVSDKIWLSFDKSSGSGSGAIETIMAVAESNTGGKRSAVVTISNGLEEQTFEVIQNGFLLEFAELTDPVNDVLFGALGETKTFGVVANIDWKVSCDDERIHLEKISGTEFTVTLKSNIYFATYTPFITLSPAVPASGVEDGVLTLSQPANVYLQGTEAVHHENGSVTINASEAVTRVVTKRNYKLGTFIWKFSNVDITNTYFDLNAWPDAGNVNYHLYLGGTGGNQVTTGGRTPAGADFWQNPAKFDLSAQDLNQMRSLKVELLPNEADQDKLDFRVYLNDELLVNVPDRINPFYVDSETSGMVYYFGFLSGTGSMTIDSFEAIPVE